MLHAQHLDQAADPRASAAYVAAARQQAELYRTEMALDLAQRGVLLAATAAERFAAAALLGRLQLDLGRAQEGRDAFTQALQLAADQAERGQALFGLAEAMRHLDGFDTALAHLSEAETGATARDQATELANIHHSCAATFSFR